MKQFKQFYKEENLNEGVVSDLWIITKDLATITKNVTKWATPKAWKGLVKSYDVYQRKYSKQARAFKKADKLANEAEKLEMLRDAKLEYLIQKKRIKEARDSLAQLSDAEKENNFKKIEKIKKQLEKAEAKIDKNLYELEKQGI